MRVLLMSCLVVAAGGCVTFGGQKTRSGWAVLGKAERVSCAQWPMREQDMQVESVATVKGERVGFLVSGLRRDAVPAHYWLPFMGSRKLDAKSALSLDFGRGTTIIGGMWAGASPVAVLTRPGKTGTTLEVRTIHDNVVRHTSELGPLQVSEGRLVPTLKGGWALLKGDAGEYRLAYIGATDADKVSAKLIPGLTFREKPWLLPRASKSGGILVVGRDGKGKSPFSLRWVEETGTVGEEVALDLPVSNQVESWSAASHGGSYYLAFVDGDSLIGAADVIVAQFDWDGAAAPVRWHKSLESRDEHLSEPVLAPGKRGLELMVLKWIDEESTIMRHMVGPDGISKPEYSGIFAKGSRVMETYVADRDYWGIVRSRDDNQWQYQLCEL